ncbi:DMT family transporter [Providencia burhodogranariea]|uniref:EamA domain-containing protein n=1 Tax=Providencia burhodogranariea DSM 19968 TaxID=1141662 RepID=K8WZY5_9GAMM|nr:hypothetical protein OOA_05631 [Providencia burhodogranariea DSM 19968]
MFTIQFRSSAGVQICTMLFGLSAVLAKDLSFPVTGIVTGRALWASITLFIIVLILRSSQWNQLAWRDWFHLSVNGVLLAGHWVCFFIGVEKGGVAIGTLGFACFPVFVTLLGKLLFGAPISSRSVIAMLLVVIGLFVISPTALFSQEDGTALLWALAAGLSYAIIILYNSYAKTAALSIQSSLIQCLACALVTLPWGYQAIIDSFNESFWHLMFIGVMCTGLAYSLLTFALRHINPNKAAIIISLEPVWAILFATLWFSTLPSIQTLIGGGLIVTAVALSAIEK